MKGSKFQWLMNAENLPERFDESFGALRDSDLKVSRAGLSKSLFENSGITVMQAGPTGILTVGIPGRSAVGWNRSKRKRE